MIAVTSLSTYTPAGGNSKRNTTSLGEPQPENAGRPEARGSRSLLIDSGVTADGVRPAAHTRTRRVLIPTRPAGWRGDGLGSSHPSRNPPQRQVKGGWAGGESSVPSPPAPPPAPPPAQDGVAIHPRDRGGGSVTRRRTPGGVRHPHVGVAVLTRRFLLLSRCAAPKSCGPLPSLLSLTHSPRPAVTHSLSRGYFLYLLWPGPERAGKKHGSGKMPALSSLHLGGGEPASARLNVRTGTASGVRGWGGEQLTGRTLSAGTRAGQSC